MNYAKIPYTYEIVAGEWHDIYFVTTDGRVFDNPGRVLGVELPDPVREALAPASPEVADYHEEVLEVVPPRTALPECVHRSIGGSNFCDFGGVCAGPCEKLEEYPF